jgi:hypothetical protein
MPFCSKYCSGYFESAISDLCYWRMIVNSRISICHASRVTFRVSMLVNQMICATGQRVKEGGTLKLRALKSRSLEPEVNATVLDKSSL